MSNVGGNSNSAVFRWGKLREQTGIVCLILKFGGITCKESFKHESTAFRNSRGASIVIVILEGEQILGQTHMSHYFSRTVAFRFKDFLTKQVFALTPLSYNGNAIGKSTKALQLLCLFGKSGRLRYHGSGSLKASTTHFFCSRSEVKLNRFTSNKFLSMSPAPCFPKLYG